MSVRRATLADVHVLAELNAVVQQMHHDVAPDWFKPPETAPALDYFREALRSDDVHTFVAEADGAVRAYALVRLHRLPETALTHGGLVVDLDQISVDPGYRGRGLARELIDHVRSMASDAGATRLQLMVWEFNTNARAVFERAGFTAAMTRMVADR
jgi:ribosomal protein S18 acetylase RimI-like enzyme